MAKGDLEISPEAQRNFIQRVYSGQLSLFALPVELYTKFFNEFMEAVFKGWGIQIGDSIEGPDFGTVRKLRLNMAFFSGAKTFSEMQAMTAELFTANGQLKPFAEFESRANVIFDQYNKNWLKTEYRSTVRTARASKRWDKFEAQKDVFPFLRYETIGDSRVRDDHRSLNGITLPVGHKFWNTYGPINGFNCRCRLIPVQKAKPTNIEKKFGQNPPTIDPIFKINPGKVNKPFKESQHPYFKVDAEHKSRAKRNFDFPTPSE